MILQSAALAMFLIFTMGQDDDNEKIPKETEAYKTSSYVIQL